MENKKLESTLEKWQSIQPLPETDRERLSRRFTVDFNYNSNHIEGNTLTYGQTELLLLFGKVIGEADFREYEEMKASNVGLKMMTVEAVDQDKPLTQNFIRTLHRTLLREDYTVYRTLPGGVQTSYVIHAGQYKTRPNSVITRYGDRFDYASPEETPSLMTDLVDWYNQTEQSGTLSPADLAILFH
jgi:Fic family protein